MWNRTFVGILVFIICSNAVTSVKESTCEPYGNRMDLSGSNLHEFPSCKEFNMSHTNIEILDLGNNNITLFEYAPIISKFPNITILFLPYNKIKYLREAENFTNNVKILDLGRNIIDEIHPRAFDSFKHLNKLYLNSNKIKKLSVDVFKSLLELKILHLSNNNLLTLDYNLFSPLKGLKELYISNNTIQDLDPVNFQWQPSLCKLNMSGNRLVRIPPLLRCGMKKNECYIDFTNNPTYCFCRNEIYTSKCRVFSHCGELLLTYYSKIPICKPIRLNIFYNGSSERAFVGCEASGNPQPDGMELIVGNERFTEYTLMMNNYVITTTVKDISEGNTIFCSAWNTLEHKSVRTNFNFSVRTNFNFSVASGTGKSINRW